MPCNVGNSGNAAILFKWLNKIAADRRNGARIFIGRDVTVVLLPRCAADCCPSNLGFSLKTLAKYIKIADPYLMTQKGNLAKNELNWGY